MAKKEITELRVYSSLDRLRHDFRKAVGVTSHFLDRSIQPNREIYIPGLMRMTFIVEDKSRMRGYRPDKVFFDELVSPETKDYLRAITDYTKDEK